MGKTRWDQEFVFYGKDRAIKITISEEELSKLAYRFSAWLLEHGIKHKVTETEENENE